MAVYGQLGEGAVNTKEHSTINLLEYWQKAFTLESLSDLFKSSPLKVLPIDQKLDKTGIMIEQLEWFYCLNDKDRQEIEFQILNRYGYKMFYNLPDLSARYLKWLDKTIVTMWYQNNKLCGFCRHVIADDNPMLSDLLSSPDFLTQTHKETKMLVAKLLSVGNGFMSCPVSTDPEGIIVPEKQSVKNGSRWSELLYLNRKRVLEDSCYQDVYFSLPNGVYKQDLKHNAVLFAEKTVPETGNYLYFVVTDNSKSCEQLNLSISRNNRNI
jgi:hypothetical protein